MAADARVLVLTPYPYGTVAGPRSSFELWERVLTDAGITFDYAVFETDRLSEVIYASGVAATGEKAVEIVRSYARMARRAVAAHEYDAVLVNREATLIGPALVERIAGRRGTPLIYLLDDPLYIPYRSPSNGALAALKCFGKVGPLCRMSAAVIANSPSNAGFARAHNANVWEIPSVVDADLYIGARADAAAAAGPEAGNGTSTGKPEVCIGWSGSPTTAINLQVVREPLGTLAAGGGVTIRCIGARDVALPEIPHVAVPWSAEHEVAELCRFDIGLVPLPLTEWTPHKFYLKLVQYMALGIPPVATPLGANPGVIDDGVTGFLAGSPAAWTATLRRLVADPDLRASVGAAAARVAHERYTLQANAERIVAAFRSVLA